MSRTIVWSRTARETYVEILLRIQENWGDDPAVKFAEKVEATLESIRVLPFMYPPSQGSPNKSIRKCVLSKQTSLFYRIEGNSVELITFFDNRNNPQNLRLE